MVSEYIITLFRPALKLLYKLRPPSSLIRARLTPCVCAGLELEYERLKSVGRDAFRLGSAQFFLSAAAVFGAATAAGFAPAAALVLGGGLALSSSAFVIQLLSEKGAPPAPGHLARG